jgi:hypothetical protein
LIFLRAAHRGNFPLKNSKEEGDGANALRAVTAASVLA